MGKMRVARGVMINVEDDKWGAAHDAYQDAFSVFAADFRSVEVDKRNEGRGKK